MVSFKFKQFLCEFHLDKEKYQRQAGGAWPPGLGSWHNSKINPDEWAGLPA